MTDACAAIHSTVTAEGTLRVTLDESAMPEPGTGQVVVAVEAAHTNR